MSLVEHFQDLILGHGTGGLADDAALLEDHQGGDGADAVGPGQLEFLIDVDLAHLDVGPLGGDLLHQGGQGQHR